MIKVTAAALLWTLCPGDLEEAPGSPLNRKSGWPLLPCRLSDSQSHVAGREQRVDRTRICLSWQWPESPRQCDLWHYLSPGHLPISGRAMLSVQGQALHHPGQAGLTGGRGEQGGLAVRLMSCLDKSWVLSHARPSLAGGQVGGRWINIKPIP